ncbi:hypothetical protein EYZ11_001759 [Aspergillus tanneri]|nr:hypothetical protein EYZ11_001759 [Aspergillus tanneri]
MKGIALRGQRASRSQALVCQLCQVSTPATPRSRTQLPRSFTPFIPISPRIELGQWRPKKALRSNWGSISISARRYTSNPSQTAVLNPEKTLEQIERDSVKLRASDSVPSDESVLRLLRSCQDVAEILVSSNPEGLELSSKQNGDNAVSSLLDLEEKKSSGKQSKAPRLQQSQLADSLSRITYDLLTDKKVFISPEVLASYTKIQTLLKQGQSFPEIFYLYAHKPVPEENSSPIRYHKSNPKNVNSAVPTELAHLALDIAIEQRNLSLVLAIIDNTFCAPAFHRAKLFKKAVVPLGGLAATPAACYAIASWASTLQNTMDPSMATGIAFAASLAYVGGVSSVGLLAITTANDQMQRVTWLPGIPLRHRWLREEERAALDKVAVAWGFKNVTFWGEEEGEEWENLREFIGMRGMILDKTDLMPGMQ